LTIAGKRISSSSVGLCRRATRSNEGEGRVFRWESQPFRFTSLPFVLKTRPSVPDSPGPSTLQPVEPKRSHNAGPASNYGDNRKLRAVLAERNISLFLFTHVNQVEMNGSTITAAIGRDVRTSKRTRFPGALFVDCTGDGNLGYLAKAQFRQGRESQAETGESLAPSEEDELVMGSSMQQDSVKTEFPSFFPGCPWAVQADDRTSIKTTKGDWNWETGADRDQVKEIEHVRDYALRVIFGNWSVLKNHPKYRDEFANRELKVW
jgi:hypothetical protein